MTRVSYHVHVPEHEIQVMLIHQDGIGQSTQQAMIRHMIPVLVMQLRDDTVEACCGDGGRRGDGHIVVGRLLLMILLLLLLMVECG